MAAPVIYWRGSEDIDYLITGATVWSQTGGRFRSGFARGAVEPGGSNNGLARNLNLWNGGAGANPFWMSFWVSTQNTAQNGINILYLNDTSNITRFRLNPNANVNNITVFKVNAAGVQTSLGNFNSGMAVNVLVKWDIFVTDAVAGLFQIYVNGSLVFSFSGDTTTDGSAHNIAYHYFGNGLNGNNQWDWSETIVSDSDTRSMALVTLAPVANGNTHNFDVGSPAAGNVNEFFTNDTTIDGASVSGLIDQYTIGSLPSGTWSILDFGISARMMRGFTGPQHMDLGVRSGASPADFWSPDFTLSTVFASYFYDWALDPSTSSTWTGLPVNIGLRSQT